MIYDLFVGSSVAEAVEDRGRDVVCLCFHMFLVFPFRIQTWVGQIRSNHELYVDRGWIRLSDVLHSRLWQKKLGRLILEICTEERAGDH